MVRSNEFDNSDTAQELAMSYQFTVDGKGYRGTANGEYYEYADGSLKKKKKGEKPLYQGKK